MIPIVVRATCTIFLAVLIVVFGATTSGFFTHTRVPVPETMAFAMQSLFFARKTIGPVSPKMAFGPVATVFVFYAGAHDSNAMSNASNAMVDVSNAMVGDLD